MQYVSIDLETCGLDSDHTLVEVGAVIDDMKSPIEKLPTFHCYILNYNWKGELEYKGHPFALAMHHEIFRRIARLEQGYEYYEPNVLGTEFKKFLVRNMKGYTEDKKITVAGKNFNGFDKDFLAKTSFFEEVKVHHRVLDPAMLYWNPDEDEQLPSLAECLQRAGLSDKDDVAHNAVDDARDVVRALRAYYEAYKQE